MRQYLFVMKIILFLIGLIYSSISMAQENILSAETLKVILNDYVESGEFSGVVAYKCNGIQETVSFGYCDREKKTPCVADTKFRIASVSKNFTAAIVMRLSEAGLLSLQDDVSKWIPEYTAERLTLNNKTVKIQHLLSHTSGLPAYETTDHALQNLWKAPVSATTMVDVVKSSPLLSEPGLQFAYSNLGYNLLALISERASGKKFDSLISEISALAHLKNTGTYLPHQEGLAKGYYVFPSTSVFDSLYNYDDFFKDKDLVSFMGAGSLYSTAEDLILWMDAVQNHKFLNSESVALMTTPDKNNFGYGWTVMPFNTTTVTWHNGALTPLGVFSEIGYSKEKQFSYALLSNIDINNQNREALKKIFNFLISKCSL